MRLSPAAALTAAIVVASAPVLVTYAGRVKPYTADVALSAIVLGAAAMADRRSRWWAFVAVSVVAVVVSATTAVTVVGAGLVAALRSPRAAWPPLLAGAAAGGAWWLLVLDDADNEGLRDFWRDHHTLERAPDAAAALVPLPGDAALVVLGLAAAAALVLRPRVALLAVAPIAVAVALGVAGAIPLGGGRTDAHLLPAVAVLVAAVVDAVPLRLLAAAAVAVVALLRASDPEPYPAEDVGPLVAAVEAAATEDQRIVVYSSARWAYALETAAPVDLLDSDREANGFEVAVDDDRVAILPRLRDEPERYPDAIDAAVGDASTVWLVVSHPGPDVADLEAALAAAGFTASERDARPGAELSRWERATR